jgi:hypothetical protein
MEKKNLKFLQEPVMIQGPWNMKHCSRLTCQVIQTVFQTLMIRIYRSITTMKLFCLEQYVDTCTCEDKVVTVRKNHPVKM